MRKALIIVAMVSMVVSGCESMQKKTGCINGNCANGKGVYVFPDGARYEGDFVKSVLHGRGSYTWPEWKNING